jgi:hypothetical protein
MRLGVGADQGVRVGIHDDIHVPLPVQHDFARAMSRGQYETLAFKDGAQRQRLFGCVLDELDAVDAQRIFRHGVIFAICHRFSFCAQICRITA